MRRQLSSTLGRLVARKRQSPSARKVHLGRSLLLGIGGAIAGGLLWQYHQKGLGQTGNIFLKVRIEKRVKCHRCLKTIVVKIAEKTVHLKYDSKLQELGHLCSLSNFLQQRGYSFSFDQ